VSSKAGTYVEADGSAVEMPDAKAAWVPFAREALVRVAHEYQALIDYKELAEEVQAQSGIRTRMLMHYWIGNVLGLVSKQCHEQGEPLLSSLCVHADGTIGATYGVALEETYGGEVPDDLEMAAAEERIRCYAHFGAEMPPDGGQPKLPPKEAKRRATTKRRAAEDVRRPVCPKCYLTLPANGECDNCNGTFGGDRQS